MSLVEVVIGVSLMILAVPMVGSLLSSGTHSAARLQADSETIDELRTQLFAIQRELRSAICIEQPGTGVTNSTTLQFTTAANGTPYRVTYVVTGGELQRTVDGEATRTVGASLVSGTFEHIANPRRSVRIRLTVRTEGARDAMQLQSVVAGRNAWETAC